MPKIDTTQENTEELATVKDTNTELTLQQALDKMENDTVGELILDPKLDTIGVWGLATTAYDEVGKGTRGDFMVGREDTLGNTFDGIIIGVDAGFIETYEFGTKEYQDADKFNTLEEAELAGYTLKKFSDPKEGKYVEKRAMLTILVALDGKGNLGDTLSNSVLIGDKYYIPVRLFTKGQGYDNILRPLVHRRAKKKKPFGTSVWTFKTEKVTNLKKKNTYFSTSISYKEETPPEVISFIAGNISQLR